MFDLKTRILARFDAAFAGAPDLIARAPGRVNLIGEHTDYNDGFVLPMAIGPQTMVAARARGDGIINLIAADLDKQTSFDVRGDIQPDAQSPWSNYVRGVAFALRADGLALRGADMMIAGNVPQGAGLSSSASLEVASGLALATLDGQGDYDRNKLALAGQRAEHEFAGCNCGIMDQLVSARGQAGHALMLDCRSLETQAVPMPDDVAVMIVHSGVQRGLVDGEYNMRRAQCEAAASHYGVAALRDVDRNMLEAGKSGLDETSYRRARHIISENARVLAAAQALVAGDLVTLGQLMAQSHASMRDDFEITVPPIDHLASALQLAIGDQGGARMTGGGFGGAVVGIMPRAMVDQVEAQIRADYNAPDGKPLHIMIEQAASGTSLL